MGKILGKLKMLGLRPWQRFRKFSTKKKIVVIIILLVVFLVISSIFGQLTKKPSYTTTQVARTNITESVSETGNIAISGKVEIFSPAKGVIGSVSVANGDNVSVGQELFTVVSTATEAEKAAALAAYLTAKNTLDTANATLFSLQATMFEKWDTFKELAEGDDYEESNGTPKYNQRALPEFHIPEKEWLAAEANYKKQQAVISQAQAALTNANLNYEVTQNATVKATSGGIISNLAIISGSTVAPFSTLNLRPALTITTNTKTEAVVPLSESDVVKVKPDQPAKIDVSAIDNHVYQGLVARVDTIGTDTSGVMRYNAYITLADADASLRSGMTVDVDITTSTKVDVLAVPNSAIKPYQGGRAVRVLNPKSKKIDYVPVQIGIKGEQMTEIVSGIDLGQEIIVSLSNEQLKRPGLFGN